MFPCPVTNAVKNVVNGSFIFCLSLMEEKNYFLDVLLIVPYVLPLL